MRFEGHIDVCRPDLVAGWARDAAAPGQTLRLSAFAGVVPLGACVASGARADLGRAGIGDHGFSFRPPHALTPDERDCLHFRTEGSASALFDAFGAVQQNPFLRTPPPPPAQPRFRRCVLHIGTEKTGSTSLQRFLALNRDALLARGVFVPASLAPADPEGALNHSDLAALALADWRLDDPLRLGRGVADAAALARFRERAAADLAAEIAVAPVGCDTLLLSSEHCHSRVLLLHEIATLHRFLTPWVGGFEVVVYLRPQHEMAMSQYAMQLLAGMEGAEMLPPLPYPAGYARTRGTDLAYFDYAGLLSRWSAVFGRAALRPALFGPDTLAEGDVVVDFCRRIGVDIATLPRPARLAGNISGRGQRFLAAFRQAMRAEGAAELPGMWEFVAGNLRHVEPGSGMTPARGAVAAFLGQFAAGNERVRAEWFPVRERLFEVDLARFPDAAEVEHLSGEEAMAVLVRLLRRAAARRSS